MLRVINLFAIAVIATGQTMPPTSAVAGSAMPTASAVAGSAVPTASAVAGSAMPTASAVAGSAIPTIFKPTTGAPYASTNAPVEPSFQPVPPVAPVPPTEPVSLAPDYVYTTPPYYAFYTPDNTVCLVCGEGYLMVNRKEQVNINGTAALCGDVEAAGYQMKIPSQLCDGNLTKMVAAVCVCMPVENSTAPSMAPFTLVPTAPVAGVSMTNGLMGSVVAAAATMFFMFRM